MITFNGEIYNYKELELELKVLGSTFKTKSDTEVILEAYKIWGIESLKGSMVCLVLGCGILEIKVSFW